MFADNHFQLVTSETIVGIVDQGDGIEPGDETVAREEITDPAELIRDFRE
jgi:hypothetical protein